MKYAADTTLTFSIAGIPGKGNTSDLWDHSRLNRVLILQQHINILTSGCLLTACLMTSVLLEAQAAS